MKKFITMCAVGAALAVTGCASKQTNVDYSHESAAPYSDSRTAGGETTAAATRADATFSKRQHK